MGRDEVNVLFSKNRKENACRFLRYFDMAKNAYAGCIRAFLLLSHMALLSPMRKFLKDTYNPKIFKSPKKSRLAPLFAALISSTAFTQTAHAQFCTAEQLNVGSTNFEGRDASGNPAGFDANDVQVGDFLVFSDTVIAGYNPAAAIDVVFEITAVSYTHLTLPTIYSV